ncbi:hypothetical protein [Variovorax sp. KK3]|uniref:hypothetical protein n=2 Tax=Variovorax sp. KK3 TaxID=1855728 RepID=UPI00117FE4CE
MSPRAACNRHKRKKCATTPIVRKGSIDASSLVDLMNKAAAQLKLIDEALLINAMLPRLRTLVEVAQLACDPGEPMYRLRREMAGKV